MAILVTGGTGYIGSHTVVELIENNEKVIIIDNLSNSEINVVDKIEKITGIRPIFILGDLRDKTLVDEVFNNYDIESVIHFAALKAVGESIEEPLKYYNNNIYSTIVLLEVMEKYNCNKLVFSSSATVYGLNENVPFSEELPLSTINPYGSTKRMIEEILADLMVSNKKISIAILRYFNPIGAHPSGLISEEPKGIPNNLLPYIAKVALGELEYLHVFGRDYDTIDGTGVRDYIHVVDLANGHLKALEYIREHKGVEALNLGTGKGYSVIEVVKAFEQASNQRIPFIFEDRRCGDIGTCYANPEKARRILGWKGKYTIDDMCEDAWRAKMKNW